MKQSLIAPSGRWFAHVRMWRKADMVDASDQRPLCANIETSKLRWRRSRGSRIGHAYMNGALDLSGNRQRAGVHGLRHGAHCYRDLPRETVPWLQRSLFLMVAPLPPWLRALRVGSDPATT